MLDQILAKNDGILFETQSICMEPVTQQKIRGLVPVPKP